MIDALISRFPWRRDEVSDLQSAHPGFMVRVRDYRPGKLERGADLGHRSRLAATAFPSTSSLDGWIVQIQSVASL